MKKFKLLAITLVLALGMSACGVKKLPAPEIPEEELVEEVTEVEEETVEEVIEEVAAYPVTIIDQAGREVVIEEEPQSLVSGYYISTSLLIALDLDDKLVGVEAKADKRKIYKLGAEHIIDLPNVGTAKEFDLEGCAALKPDLAILPMKLKEAAASLEELDIKTILVNPESEELLLEMIDIIATATNTKAEAEKLVAFIDENKEMLETSLKDIAPKSVYLAGNSDLLSTAGSKMYQAGMIALAGGANAAEEIEDTYWAEVSYEQILAWNPEYIIIAADASYTEEDVLNDAALAACDAVVNGNVYKMPSDVEAWDSPVPSGILGSVWLASVLNPEVITEEARDGIIEEYYEEFYGFKYSEK